MNRIQFLKLIGLMLAPTTLQTSLRNEVKYYKHDEIFHQPYNNPILFYFRKESEIYK